MLIVAFVVVALVVLAGVAVSINALVERASRRRRSAGADRLSDDLMLGIGINNFGP